MGHERAMLARLAGGRARLGGTEGPITSLST